MLDLLSLRFNYIEYICGFLCSAYQILDSATITKLLPAFKFCNFIDLFLANLANILIDRTHHHSILLLAILPIPNLNPQPLCPIIPKRETLIDIC
jgi:hypothetical protein